LLGTPLFSLQMGMDQDGRWQTLEVGPPALGLGYFNMQTRTARPGVLPFPFKGRPGLLCGRD
jgi:hypothetical protein